MYKKALLFMVCAASVSGCAQSQPPTAPDYEVADVVPPVEEPAYSSEEEAFEAWAEVFRTEAAAEGVSQGTLDAVFNKVVFKPRVIELDRKQPEGTITHAQYLQRVVPQSRIEKARRKLHENRALLERIGAKYGVQPRFIVALWGIETDFGGNTGGFYVPSALATLAFDGRRSSYFRGELLNALKIMDAGHIAPHAMKGSWAGALGQCQFMPSSFLSFAVDENGDGRKDIWGTKEDIFASIANYLAQSGWNDEETWGRKIQLPAGFDTSQAESKTTRDLAEWQAHGVRKNSGAALPQAKVKGRVVLPGDSLDNAYMAYGNYDVLMKWNRSNYFATAVGTLADALR